MGVIRKIIDRMGAVKKETWTVISTMTGNARTAQPSTDPGELLKNYKNTVYICVNKISNRIGQLDSGLYREGRGDEAVEVTNGPLVDLMETPNPFYTWSSLIEKTIMHMELTGDGYWLKVRGAAGQPAELWALRPDLVTVVLDERGHPKSYAYGLPNQVVYYKPEDVIHFRFGNPNSDWLGMGTVEAMAWSVDIDNAMRVYEKGFFTNSARPDFILVSKTRMTDTAVKQFYERWQNRFEGEEKSYRPVILEGAETDVKQLSLSPKDFAFVDMAKWTRDDILAAFGVPPSTAGYETSVNRATAYNSDVVFNRDCILPRLRIITSAINRWLCPEFGEGFYVEYENPVPRDEEYQAAVNSAYLSSGVLTINEVRQGQGLDEVEWGEDPWLQSSLAQISSGADTVKDEKNAISPTSVLNGAQVTAMLEVTANVASGILEPAAGIAMLVVAFGLTDAAARAIIDNVGMPKPEPEPEPVPPAPEPEPVVEPEEEEPESIEAALVEYVRGEYESDGGSDTHPWYAYVKVHGEEEDTLRKVVARLFRGDAEYIMSRLDRLEKRLSGYNGWNPAKAAKYMLKAGDYDDLFPPSDEWVKMWLDGLLDDILETTDRFGEEAAAEATRLVGAFDWSIENPQIIEAVKTALSKGLKDITETTRSDIKKVIRDGVADALSVDDIASNILDKFDTWTDGTRSRSFTIARTETTKASNHGKNLAWKEAQEQTGIKLQRVWSAAQDERTRDTHSMEDGNTSPMNGTFPVTGLAYPGDPSGPPEEVVNCRCTMSVRRAEGE